MSAKTTTRIECDCVIDGKKCDAIFIIPNPPEGEVEGLKNLVSIDVGGQTYYFCNMIHLIAFALAWFKSAKVSTEQERELRAHMAMAEIEDLSVRE